MARLLGRGTEDESSRSQHTGCQVGVEHLAVPASFEARGAPAEADGHFRSRSSSRGATRVAVSLHPKVKRLARISACSHEESGCSTRLASRSRV